MARCCSGFGGRMMSKREPFGSVALRLGLTNKEQLEEALAIQDEEDKAGKEHRLLGLIMLEMGYLTTTELIEVLRHIDEAQEKKESRK